MSFMWRDFLENCRTLGLNFFSETRSHKMIPCKVSYFFDFFELVTPNLGPAWHDARENSRLWPGGLDSYFNGQSSMNKCRIVDPKMIFFKKLGARHTTAKVQTHPICSRIGRSLRKIQNIPRKVCVSKWELICASQEVYYLYGVLCLAFD
jgi:hypothetical protein